MQAILTITIPFFALVLCGYLAARRGLQALAFELLLPGDEPESPAAMMAIGFMLAVLGRGRMACLMSGKASVPAALKGATSIGVDDSGLWRLLLAREMKRSGLDVDLNRAM